MKCQKCNEPTVGNSRYCRTHRAESRQNFKAMVAQQAAEREAAYAELARIFAEAEAAGKEAAAALTPTPMVVVERANPLDDNSPVVKRYPPVMDGPCGFASVVITPGNCRAANYAKQHLSANKHYYGGVAIPIHEYNQSYERKMVHAAAVVSVLKKHNIDAHTHGRLD